MSTAPQCPKCKTALKDDYGMVTCAKCGSILLVDMDGVVHEGREQPATTSQAVDLAPSQLIEESEAPMSQFEIASPVPDLEPMPDNDGPVDLTEPATTEDLSFQNAAASSGMEVSSSSYQSDPVSLSSSADADSAEAEDVSAAAPEPEPELNMDAILGYQPPPEADQSLGQDQQPAEFGSPGDPLGINEYANSEVSQGKDGLLLFKILISGIDSKEIRESLREAIEDSRFGWDASQLIGRIEKGNLEIDRVSPIKATILANRIKRLPIRIRWEQYAIMQMDEGDHLA